MARSAHQSAQRYPLTQVLGTDSNVRLLRELARHGGQLAPPELQERTGLAKSSVLAGLASLEETGLVSMAGRGRSRLYSLRSQHPLRAALDALFAAEEARFDGVLEAVRQAAAACGATAAWLYGSAARGEDRFGSDLDVAIVFAEEDQAAVDRLRDQLREDGERLGFEPSVAALTPADAVRLAKQGDPIWGELARDAVVLFGARPDDVVRQSKRASSRKPAA